jgi:hypothetical protein
MGGFAGVWVSPGRASTCRLVYTWRKHAHTINQRKKSPAGKCSLIPNALPVFAYKRAVDIEARRYGL